MNREKEQELEQRKAQFYAKQLVRMEQRLLKEKERDVRVALMLLEMEEGVL